MFWFTGLSGAGKTSVARAVEQLLKADGYSVLVLDGDDIRKRLHVDLGFTEIDIKRNNELVAELCYTYRNDYQILLVAIISPYIASRELARNLLGERFYEIYFSADLATVSARDVKGLYSKAKRREIDNLIGFSNGSIYQPPLSADLVIDSSVEGIEESIAKLHQFATQCLERNSARN